MSQVELIEEVGDPRLCPFVDLRRRKEGDPFFIAEGRLTVQRLLASDYQVASLLVQRGQEEEYAGLADPGTPIYSLCRDQLRQVVGFDFHRGVLACGVRKPLRPVGELRLEVSDRPIVLALSSVTELENVGSILRSAAAFGIRHVLVGPGTCDPYGRRVIRVSMANLFRLQLYRWSHPVEQLESLHCEAGFRSVAATPDDRAVSLEEFKADGHPVVLIIGNEAKGIAPEVLAAATDRVTIPMQLGTDSLNAAVAAAVFMYRLSRKH